MLSGNRGTNCTRTLAATINKSNPPITTELTSQVVPNKSAILLTICASSNMNPAPKKKKCQRGEEPAAAPISRSSTQQSSTRVTEITTTDNGRPGSC